MVDSLWEDENTLGYEIVVRGTTVIRRLDNNMINGTTLLNVANVLPSHRDELLGSEKVRHVVRLGRHHLRGVWIPCDRALHLANQEAITPLLYPLFVEDIIPLIESPLNQAKASPNSSNGGNNSHAWSSPTDPFSDPAQFSEFVRATTGLSKDPDLSPLSRPSQPRSSVPPQRSLDAMRLEDPHTVREPPVAGPFHTSWEAAIEEDFASPATMQDEVSSLKMASNHLTPGEQANLYGRHGDVNPKNILLFDEETSGVPQIGDLEMMDPDSKLAEQKRRLKIMMDDRAFLNTTRQESRDIGSLV
jgi:hypothetical protein